MRYLDNVYSTLLIKFDSKSKSFYLNDDQRSNLPEEKVIKKTNEFSNNLFPKS